MRAQTLSYFRWAFAVTGIGLALAFWLGFVQAGGLQGALTYLFIGTVLAILEISLSFDNAIVNANKLKDMTPAWQRRFLTWGILIAVFGMRVLFPLLVVTVAAGIGPFSALELAISRPDEYARIIGESHIPIAAFGGTFLMMVAIAYFIDENKDVDWIGSLERWLRNWGSVRGMEIALVLAVVVAFASTLKGDDASAFLYAAIAGLLTFTAVDIMGRVLDRAEKARDMAAQGGLGAFLYLEVLDASFSFDGVIGAFALTKNLFLIAIGLGIGAMYVRSMTIMLVEKKTLTQFRYLEHGAFYSIFILSVIMFAQTIIHVPEVITGLIGAGIVGISFYSSVRYNKRPQNTA